MSVYLKYVLNVAHCGVCSKGSVRGSQLCDKTKQMHLYSQQHYLNAWGKKKKKNILQTLSFLSSV